MTKELSYKISFTNILLAFLIVILHSNCEKTIGWRNDGMLFAKLLKCFVDCLNGIGHIAVPLFYIISAYLFYYNIKSSKDIYSKIKKRVKTLFVPYILWNVLFVFVFWVILNSPFSKYMNMENDLDSLYNIMKAILNSEKTPLWFIRNLLFYVMLSPIIYNISRYSFIIILSILGGMFASFVFKASYFSPLYWFPIYMLGVLFTKRDFEMFFQKSYTSLVVWVFTILFFSFLLYLYVVYDMTYLYRFVAPICFWVLLDYVLMRIRFDKKKYWNYSFFIYCVHFFIINVFQKILYMMLGNSNLSYLCIYMVTPIVVIPICIVVAKKCENRIPKVYSILTGGR